MEYYSLQRERFGEPMGGLLNDDHVPMTHTVAELSTELSKLYDVTYDETKPPEEREAAWRKSMQLNAQKTGWRTVTGGESGHVF